MLRGRGAMYRFILSVVVLASVAVGGCAIAPACDADETEFCPISNKSPLACQCVKNTASGPSNPTQTTRR